MYKIIADVDEILYFYNNVLPPLIKDEVYFISLSARNKYLNEEERQKLQLGRTEMFSKKIIRDRDYSKFLRTLRKFETNEGSYLTKNGLNIPNDIITCYINVNPSSSLRALKEFNDVINEMTYNLQSNTKDNEALLKGFRALDNKLLTCYQKNRGTKHYIDIDTDGEYGISDIQLIEELLEETFKMELNMDYFIISTKSGFHTLIKKSFLTFNPNLIAIKIKEVLPNAKEVVINNNEMIPLPGTYQAGSIVRIWR